MEHIAITWDRLTQDCGALARLLLERGIVTGDTKGLIALARGGLSVAQLVGNYLDIRRIENVTIKSYEGTQRLESQTLLGIPSPDLGDGTGWIVVDDLVDTGGSYRFLKTILPHARYVALYHKPQGLSEAELTVHGFAQDTWLDFPWEVQKIV